MAKKLKERVLEDVWVDPEEKDKTKAFTQALGDAMRDNRVRVRGGSLYNVTIAPATE